MKNILSEKPPEKLSGRLLASSRFVDDADLAGKDVVDVGCGFGWFEVDALRRGVRSVTGLEMSAGDLETAKTHVTDLRATFSVGSAIEVPLADGSADTIVSWEVIEHIPKGTEDRMFQEARRILRPGGAFYLSTPHATCWSNLFDPAWWLVGHRHYSVGLLREYAGRHGFESETISVRGNLWTLIAVLDMYVAKWIFRRRPFFEDFFLGKTDSEYARPGFVNIFMKMIKP